MFPPKEKLCRFSGFEKSCRQLVMDGKCTDAWTNIQGTHPQSGAPMDKWGCCFELSYLLTLEASRKAHHAAADVERLGSMIFDPDVRARELAKANEMKTIEAPKQ